MAPNKPAVDLNAMISADRQRRKNENIAKEVFGKARRASAPGVVANKRKPGVVPSLASRIGVTGAGVAKRSISTSTRPARPIARPAGNVDADWTHDLHGLNNPPATKFSQAPRGPKASRPNRNDHIYSALNSSASSPALNSQFNIVGTAKPASSMSIRGLAGPSIVIAKNLANGTTTADIESAMTPVGGVVLSCRIISERPKVIAELVFETKEGADNVVDTFNNQNADGNLLEVYHKSGPLPAHISNTTSKAAPISAAAHIPQGPRADRVSGRSNDSERHVPRERSRERRREYTREDVVDGSYGSDDRMDTDSGDANGGNLYSDNLVTTRGRGFANGQDRGGRGDRRSYR